MKFRNKQNREKKSFQSEDWIKWTAIFTGVIAVATIGYVILTFTLWRSAIRTENETTKLYHELNDPILGIDNVRLMKDTVTGNWFIAMAYRNFGKTVATHVIISKILDTAMTIEGEDPFPYRENSLNLQIERTNSDYFIVPELPMEIEPFIFRMDNEHINEMEVISYLTSGRVPYYLRVEFKYQNLEGDKFTAEYQSKYDLASRGFLTISSSAKRDIVK